MAATAQIPGSFTINPLALLLIAVVAALAVVVGGRWPISMLSFDRRTVAGRRSRRGLIALAVSVAGGVVVIGIMVAVQSVLSLLGVE